jgi:16S rRNA (cytosine967-C5)-methyltransferase
VKPGGTLPVPLAHGPVRARAAAALDHILGARVSAEAPLATAATDLVGADRRLLFELVLGSLRWLRRLDWTISQASGRALKKIEPGIRSPLRIAAYQLLFLDRIPSYAAVDEAVRDVRRRGRHRATGFTNAVLRRLSRRRSLAEWPVEADSEVERLGLETSHPDFLVKRWLERFETQTVNDLLAANNEPKPMHLLCLADRSIVSAELRSRGVETSDDVLSPFGLRVLSGDPLATPVFRGGRIYVQDDASQAAALVPGPCPGEVILDAAASPGGKGFALKVAEPSVRLVAADISLGRLRTLRDNEERLRISMRSLVADSRFPPFTGDFGRVVLDLPCSGTGTIGRHPELKWRLSEEEILRLATQGEALLESCSKLVRPGGLLCVITCSLEADENEFVVGRFLERSPGFELVSLVDRLPDSMSAGVEAEGRWRVLTTSDHDGFTVHVMRRRRDD